MQRVIAVLAVLVCTGCSFWATSSPKAPPSPPSCSPSKGPPGLDLAISMVSLIAATGFGIASAWTKSDEKEKAYGTTAGLLTLPALGFGAASLLGGWRVRQCDRAIKNWDLMQQ